MNDTPVVEPAVKPANEPAGTQAIPPTAPATPAAPSRKRFNVLALVALILALVALSALTFLPNIVGLWLVPVSLPVGLLAFVIALISVFLQNFRKVMAWIALVLSLPFVVIVVIMVIALLQLSTLDTGPTF